MKMKRELCLCLGVAALLASGCSTEVSYGDAKETETVTVDYGSTDLQSLSGKMVQSLIDSPATTEISVNGRPVLFVDSIRNKSS